MKNHDYSNLFGDTSILVTSLYKTLRRTSVSSLVSKLENSSFNAGVKQKGAVIGPGAKMQTDLE